MYSDRGVRILIGVHDACAVCFESVGQLAKIDAFAGDDGFPHQMDPDEDTRHFFVTPRDYAVTAGVNACRLQQSRLGGCTGFAVDSPPGAEGRRVTLLYKRGPSTFDYRADQVVDPEAYSIAACL